MVRVLQMERMISNIFDAVGRMIDALSTLGLGIEKVEIE